MTENYSHWLEVLGLSDSASSQEIRQAYLDLVNVWHPDRFGANPRLRSKADEKLKEINEAYRHLIEYRPTSKPPSSPSSRPSATTEHGHEYPQVSLKTVYTAFRFLKNERASTSLQRDVRQKKLDHIASGFVNMEIAALARVENVWDALIHATLDLRKSSQGTAYFALSVSFGDAFRQQALTLRVGNHIKVCGTLMGLAVSCDLPYPSMELKLLLTFVEVIQSPNYEILAADLDQLESKLRDVDWFTRLRTLENDEQARLKKEADEEQARLKKQAEGNRREYIQKKRSEIVGGTGHFAFGAAVIGYCLGGVGGCWHRFGTDPNRSLSYCFGAFTSTGPILALCAAALVGLIGAVWYTNVDS